MPSQEALIWFLNLSYNHIRNNVLKSNGLRMNNTLTCFNQIYNGILFFLDTANNQGFCSTIHEVLAYFNLTSKIVMPIPTLIISFAYIMNYLLFIFWEMLMSWIRVWKFTYLPSIYLLYFLKNLSTVFRYCFLSFPLKIFLCRFLLTG